MPRLQFPIRIGQRTFRADFAYPEHKLIIEVMGYRWHGGRARWEQDLSRSSELGAAGWRILYVTKAQMVTARPQTMDRVRQALGYCPLFIL
jgi:very-short-patch-repair endonuclease